MVNAQNLNEYVEGLNKWRMIWNHLPLDPNSASDRQRIAESLEGELSPENLTCDGELPRSQVQARYRQLMQAAKELKQLDPSVKMYEFA